MHCDDADDFLAGVEAANGLMARWAEHDILLVDDIAAFFYGLRAGVAAEDAAASFYGRAAQALHALARRWQLAVIVTKPALFGAWVACSGRTRPCPGGGGRVAGVPGQPSAMAWAAALQLPEQTTASSRA